MNHVFHSKYKASIKTELVSNKIFVIMISALAFLNKRHFLIPNMELTVIPPSRNVETCSVTAATDRVQTQVKLS